MKIVSPTCMLAATNQVPCLILCSEPVKSLSVFMWSLGSQYSHMSMINETITVSLFHKWYYASLVFTVNKYNTTHSQSKETFFSIYFYYTKEMFKVSQKLIHSCNVISSLLWLNLKTWCFNIIMFWTDSFSLGQVFFLIFLMWSQLVY